MLRKQKHKAKPSTSTSRRVSVQLSESKSTERPVSVSRRTKIAIGATLVCGAAFTAAYWFTKQSDTSPYTITCTNPPFPINGTDLDFRIAHEFNDLTDLAHNISQPTPPAFFTGPMLHLKEAIIKELPCMVSASVYNWLQKPIIFAFAKSEMFKRISNSSLAVTFTVLKNGRHIGQMLFQSPTDTNNLKNCVQNEAFHLICMQANNAKTTKAVFYPLVGYPFLNESGTIDLALKKKYFAAIAEFEKNLDEIDTIVNKRSALTPKERAKRDEASAALQDYQPALYNLAISRNLFNQWKSYLKVGQILPKANAELFKINRAIVIERIDENVDGSFKISYSSYGRNKAEIFAADYKVHRLFLPSEEKENERMVQYGSNINMLPLRAMQHLAAGFCEYMREYLGIGKDEFCKTKTTAPSMQL